MPDEITVTGQHRIAVFRQTIAEQAVTIAELRAENMALRQALAPSEDDEAKAVNGSGGSARAKRRQRRPEAR